MLFHYDNCAYNMLFTLNNLIRLPTVVHSFKVGIWYIVILVKVQY